MAISMAEPTDKPFRVSIVVKVDRPELRGASYAPVAPGTRVLCVEYHATQTEAISSFEAVLRGTWDFSSEYAASVQVDRMRSDRGPRSIRRRVERAPRETERDDVRARLLLQVAAVRRSAARGVRQPDWMFPLVWRRTSANVTPSHERTTARMSAVCP